MNYEIELTEDDLLTIISLLENSGSASLAVKVRDQMYEQRQRFFATFGQGAKPQQKPMSDKEAVDYRRFPMKKDRLRQIEEEGYRAARAGESKSMHLYHTRDERMAFDAGYYKGTIEVNRAREAKKEEKR